MVAAAAMVVPVQRGSATGCTRLMHVWRLRPAGGSFRQDKSANKLDDVPWADLQPVPDPERTLKQVGLQEGYKWGETCKRGGERDLGGR